MKTLLKLVTLFALGVSTGWLSAQTVNVYPASPITTAGAYQTITALVNGANDKTVTWSTDGGTLVGTNPCVANEPCAIALRVTLPGTYHVTATSNANGAATATSTITVNAASAITTGHPRFFVKSGNLAALQTKATVGNPMYQGLLSWANGYYTSDSSIWTFSTWSGSACTGGSGPSSPQQGNFRENDAYWMSLIALSGPTSTVRNQYGCAARDIYMTNIGYGIAGTLSLDPNRWSGGALAWLTTADNLMTGGYLSSSDIATVRQWAYVIAKQMFVAGAGNVALIGSYNDPAQFQASNPDAATGMRAWDNNYTQSRIYILTSAALLFDDNTTDDPPLTNTCSATRYQVCSDGTAGSLHAYWPYVWGSYLYNFWAAVESPSVTVPAYNTAFANLSSNPNCNTEGGWTSPCMGLVRGGESAEGFFYGGSLASMAYMSRILINTGYFNPASCLTSTGGTSPCPQLSIVTSDYFDLHLVADLSTLTGWSGISGQQSRWNVLTHGDANSYWSFPASYTTEGALLAMDFLTGRSDRSSALEWIMLNTAFGGPDGTHGGCTGTCGFDALLSNTNGVDLAFNMMLALPASDPVTSLPTDPRPSLPTLFTDAGNGHIVLRDNWLSSDTVYSAYCTDTLIDHEHQFCGGFSLYSNGEYISKGRSEFNDYNDVMSTAQQQDTLALINNPSVCTSSYPGEPQCIYGGQFRHDWQNGLMTWRHSELPGYAAQVADTTNAYNGSGSFAPFNQVTAASRSMIYLRGAKQVVMYDRGATGALSLDKTTNILTTGTPTLATGTATWLTQSGTQKVAYTPILPASATFTSTKLSGYPTMTAPFQQLHLGNTMQATCTGTYMDGTSAGDVSSAGHTRWASDNPAVATVSSTGLVTAVATGGADIICSWFGTTAQGSMTVVSGASGGAFVGNSDQDQTMDWETRSVLTVDAGNQTASQFMGLLEYGPSSMTPSGVSLVQSTSGQGFDGALIQEQTLVMFMRSLATFTGTTYPASGATTHYVSDLAPNTTYTVSASGGPATATTDTAGVMTFASDGTGNVVLSTGGLPTAVTPTFSPVAGTYIGSQAVTVTSTSSGAIKCYNFTGSPSTNGGTGCGVGSTLYSGPITVASSSTLYAVAGGTGYLDSPVGSAAYVINLPAAATPTCTPPAGTYTSTQTVTCSSTTSASTTYCTIDGSTPTTSSPVCTGVSVATSLTLKAISAASGFSNSAILTQGYTITPAVTPQVSISGTTVTGSVTIQ